MEKRAANARKMDKNRQILDKTGGKLGKNRAKFGEIPANSREK